jgi:hypothetical protein
MTITHNNNSEAPKSMTDATPEFKLDYGKLVEEWTLADVVVLVEGERFPVHRGVFAERIENFVWTGPVGDVGGEYGGWGQEIEQVTVGFSGGREEGSSDSGGRRGGKGKVKENQGGNGVKPKGNGELKVHTSIKTLVWAHLFGSVETRKVETEYFVLNDRHIRVGFIYNCVPIFSVIFAFVQCRTNC